MISAYNIIRNRIPLYENSIYFLINKNKIVYVGSSVSVLKRISSHTKKRDMVFDSYNSISSNSENFRHIEKKYIEKFKPKYNIKNNTNNTPPTGKRQRINKIKDMFYGK